MYLAFTLFNIKPTEFIEMDIREQAVIMAFVDIYLENEEKARRKAKSRKGGR